MTDALRAARERLEQDVVNWFAPVSTGPAMLAAIELLRRRLDDVVQAARLHDASAPF